MPLTTVPYLIRLQLEPEVIDALRTIAAREDRTINRLVARILREATQEYRDAQAREEADAVLIA